MYVINIHRGYNWFLGSDPITTYYQTTDPSQAIKFPTREAALAAVSTYYRGDHNNHLNKHRWSITTI